MVHHSRHLHSIYIEPSFSLGVRAEMYRKRDGTLSGPYFIMQRLIHKARGAGR